MAQQPLKATPQSNPASDRRQDGNESEDCLVLNVWSRGGNDGGKRPVLFWIHGGGFSSLSGSSPAYDGTNLALRGDVVVITINHRLNILGFTHFGDFGNDDFASSGTVGMQDIVHALKWVRDNIENFGGDPNRVTIFGESGGGRKVGTLLAMPSAKGLFHRAIIESGATLKLPEREQAAELAKSVLDELGIAPDELHKLQELPVDAIMSAYVKVGAGAIEVGGGAFAPTRDGNVIPYHPFWPEASPVNPDVPVIIGSNRTELSYFDRAGFDIDEAGMRERFAGIVGAENVDRVVATYREANPDASVAEIYFLVISDDAYVIPGITMAERRAALGGAPVYLYYLTWEVRANGGRLMSPHTLDIPLVFDNSEISPLTRGSADAAALAAKVSETVIAFARTGNPNAGTLPQWQPYEASERQTMVLNDVSELVADPIESRRELMQSLLDL
ncbi:MAG: carboxylesterase family protein [Pseudohongiellaceae bacterium]|nr:carboxylesterase family protein [Pseudohongiellaceae bacterium]